MIPHKIDKEEFSKLPIVSHSGNVVVVNDVAQAEAAIQAIRDAHSIVGFDTETRPAFVKGVTYKVCLVQLSVGNTGYLFRLNLMEGLPAPIVRLLQDNSVTKVGLSLHDDFHCLSRRAKFKPGTFIELQNEVKRIGIKDMSLQKIYANLFGEKIAKNQQLSNWEADVLSPGQQLYAATDAWACIRIHEEITRLILTQDYKIEINEQDIPETRQR